MGISGAFASRSRRPRGEAHRTSFPQRNETNESVRRCSRGSGALCLIRLGALWPPWLHRSAWGPLSPDLVEPRTLSAAPPVPCGPGIAWDHCVTRSRLARHSVPRVAPGAVVLPPSRTPRPQLGTDPFYGGSPLRSPGDPLHPPSGAPPSSRKLPRVGHRALGRRAVERVGDLRTPSPSRGTVARSASLRCRPPVRTACQPPGETRRKF